MRILENILLFIVFVLMLPVMPFLMLLSKVHEKLHENDPPNY
jgi:hypothetical protein